ncbi:hypothetical protein MMC26_007182 [Xylographa opegraphella]|nr:hypothetical protein [Xylographa opegraphella]
MQKSKSMHVSNGRAIADVAGSIINSDHFNVTTLNYFNYTFYEFNSTISNASACYLVLPNLHPTVLSNGTWVNGTSCYDPYYGIGLRGSLGILFACLFAASITLTLANLGKHGRLFLQQEKRFGAIGRRWQWYWMCFVAACGIIGGASAVDVDRDYLQGLAIILQSFFFYLMIPGLLGVVWEEVRHWGSWQERQAYDQDPFSLPQNDKRSRKEFFMPLIFYLFAWLNFFLNIPRNWGGFDAQSSAEEIDITARPLATDVRFKMGAISALAAWCIICWALQHAIHYYKPRNRGAFKSSVGLIRQTPIRFLLTIPLLLIVIGYTLSASFLWELHPGNIAASVGWLYGLGYSPTFLILIINEVDGFMRRNEDRELIDQRMSRGLAIDAEIGFPRARKPWWWQKAEDRFLTPEQRLKALTTEIGGGPATSRNIQRNVELGILPVRRPEDDEEPFRDQEARSGTAFAIGDSDSDSGQSVSQRTTSTTASRPQQVKSMLDV